MSDKLVKLEEQLEKAQKRKDNWYQCMLIQLAIFKEINSVESLRVHTKLNS